MLREYRAITVGEALARMRADAASLATTHRIGWTATDRVFPTASGVLWLATAAGTAMLGLIAWPPALAAAAASLVIGLARVRVCVVTAIYTPRGEAADGAA